MSNNINKGDVLPSNSSESDEFCREEMQALSLFVYVHGSNEKGFSCLGPFVSDMQHKPTTTETNEGMKRLTGCIVKVGEREGSVAEPVYPLGRIISPSVTLQISNVTLDDMKNIFEKLKISREGLTDNIGDNFLTLIKRIAEDWKGDYIGHLKGLLSDEEVETLKGKLFNNDYKSSLAHASLVMFHLTGMLFFAYEGKDRFYLNVIHFFKLENKDGVRSTQYIIKASDDTTAPSSQKNNDVFHVTIVNSEEGHVTAKKMDAMCYEKFRNDTQEQDDSVKKKKLGM
jgi:hypothetical protein